MHIEASFEILLHEERIRDEWSLPGLYGYVVYRCKHITFEVARTEDRRVYLHATGQFEVWLSARNRMLTEQSGTTFQATYFYDDQNRDAIIERTLTSAPNFDETEQLAELIEREVKRFIRDVETTVEGGL